MSTILLRNAHVIDPATGRDEVTSIRIENGIISSLDATVSGTADQDIDLKGRIVAPGFCDMHVHFRDPGQEYKESLATGAASAMAGGFTAVACMPNTKPCMDSAQTVRYVLDNAKSLPVDIHVIGAVTKNREGKELAPLAEMYKEGAVAFSDDGSPVFNAQLLRIAMEYLSMFDVTIIQHAEDPHLAEGGVMNEGFHSTLFGLPGIPSLAEDTVVGRDIAIAEYLDCPYHVAHLSTIGAAAQVRTAKERGLKVTCEVTPHHFTLSDDAVRSYDTNTKMNPPLRTMDDVVALKEALRDGVIDAIATDHAPHAIHEKEVEYIYAPFGIVGLETAVGLAFTELVHGGWLSIPDLIDKFSTNPRRILRLPALHIEPGEPANLTILDPELCWTVDRFAFRSRSKNSPFHGMELRGRAIGVFARGQFHSPLGLLG